jgi:hypothetical protein
MNTNSFTNNCGLQPTSLNVVTDLTFDNYASPKESKYIVKAVGEILLEIQNYISRENQRDSRNGSRLRKSASRNSGTTKRSQFQSQKMLSDDEMNPRRNEINEPTEQTYHRRVLDKVVSEVKKPVDYQNGSLDLKEIASNKFPVTNESPFHRRELANETSPSGFESNKISRLGNVYSINRVKLNINAFVCSFYKHYPIVSHSSFVLSLIYIDRFIKSQKMNDLTELAKFSFTR